MKAAFIGAMLLFVALAQVTASPLFPVRGAIPDLPLVALVLVAAYVSVRAAMVALPVLAVFLGFLTSHEPAAYIVAYLPLLPLAYLLEQSNLPLNTFARSTLAGLATGMVARATLSITAMVQVEEVMVGPMVWQVLLPGLLLDAALLILAYGGGKLAGWESRRLILEPSGY
ncbi:MAG: hypothetical protein Kow0010_06870 [Dehalococcoidia bacterium]